MKNIIKLLILPLGAILIVISFLYIYNLNNKNTQNISINDQQTKDDNKSISQESGYSQNASNFVDAYLRTLSYLYKSTERLTDVQKSYGDPNQQVSDIMMLTATGEMLNDL